MEALFHFPIIWVVLCCATLNWLSTFLGASLVYFVKKDIHTLQEIALGSSSGIMIAATFFSLLLPAIDLLEQRPKYEMALLPVAFFIGAILIGILDKQITLGHNVSFSKAKLLLIAMTLHNIPEGLAVGVAFAHPSLEAKMMALMLSIGIGIQNFPEGLAISLPMYQAGTSKFKAMMYGQYSALVEIPSAILGYLVASLFSQILPYALAFAGGAMMFVVVEELIPGSKQQNSLFSTTMTMLGFMIMMALDLLLG